METLSDLLVPLKYAAPLLIAGSIATFLEWRFPRRNASVPLSRWINSVVLYLAAVPILALVLPALGYALAKWTEKGGGGILHLDALPLWAAVAVTMVILDFVVFFSHYVMHRVDILWRLHRVHHTDTMVSASTGLLHHPIEALVVNCVGFALIPLLGLKSEGIVIFGTLQFVFNIWHHTNVANFPGQYALGTVIFTPDLHRVHHSIDRAHHTANLGLVLTIWDRLFGTYVRERDLDKRIAFGLNPADWSHPRPLVSLLIDPVRK